MHKWHLPLWLLAVLSCSCSIGPFRIERRISLDLLMHPSLGGDAVVYFDGTAAVRVRGNKTTRVKLKGRPCYTRYDASGTRTQVYVDPDGEHALIEGLSPVPGTAFHHGGGVEQIDLRCWVDFREGSAMEAQKAQPSLAVAFASEWQDRWILGRKHFYVVKPTGVISVQLANGKSTPLGTPVEYGKCSLVEDLQTTTIACQKANGVLVWRYDMATSPPRQLQSWALPKDLFPFDIALLKLSLDGNRLAYYGSNPIKNQQEGRTDEDRKLGVIDISTQAPLFVENPGVKVDRIAFAHRGDWLMVGELLGEMQVRYTGRIRVLSMTGAHLAEGNIDSPPDEIMPLAGADDAWITYGDKTYLIGLKGAQPHARAAPR